MELGARAKVRVNAHRRAFRVQHRWVVEVSSSARTRLRAEPGGEATAPGVSPCAPRELIRVLGVHNASEVLATRKGRGLPTLALQYLDDPKVRRHLSPRAKDASVTQCSGSRRRGPYDRRCAADEKSRPHGRYRKTIPRCAQHPPTSSPRRRGFRNASCKSQDDSAGLIRQSGPWTSYRSGIAWAVLSPQGLPQEHTSAVSWSPRGQRSASAWRVLLQAPDG